MPKKQTYEPVKCPKAGCTGHLTIARLQWIYTPLLIDPSVKPIPPERDENPSAIPGERNDDRLTEADKDDLGDMSDRNIQCDDCGFEFDESDDTLMAYLDSL